MSVLITLESLLGSILSICHQCQVYSSSWQNTLMTSTPVINLHIRAHKSQQLQEKTQLFHYDLLQRVQWSSFNIQTGLVNGVLPS